MPRKLATKAYRNQLRERLARLGVAGAQLLEQVVAELARCGYRPREAWRLAHELTQEEVAARINQVKADPKSRARGSRICEYEKWPIGGVRPSVRSLKILAAVYEITWDRLVDIHDLEEMPDYDRQAFLDLSDLRYGDTLDLPVPRQRRHRPSAPRGDSVKPVNPPITSDEPATVRERLALPEPAPLFERAGGGLPGENTHFTGRDGPMAELRAQIVEQPPQTTVVTIYAIDGMAGVGKTAFARHAAQELTERYPDGAIWVDLYGHTPGMPARDPSGALEQMLLQLGVPAQAIKADLAGRQDQWRHHIHARRKLIVLDNARTSDQVLPLLPEAPGCLVLITSRRKLTGLTDAYPLSLDVLGWDEAERLFINLVGEQRCVDRDAVRQILDACGRLPLAIRLIAGRLRHHRDELLADVAADLADQTAALDALAAEHLSVRAAFEWSYQLLTDEQRRAFRLLGWHPGPEITPVVIVALAAVSPTLGRQLLRELVDQNLLDQLSVAGVPGGPRYRMHDLVRLYARERADQEEPPAARAAAVDRLAVSYLAITRAADRLLRPYVVGDPGDNTGRGPVLVFADAAQARAWLTVERLNLLGCVRAMSPSTDAADLVTVLAMHFRDFGFWSDIRYLYNLALTLARFLGDRRVEVDALWGLGELERLVGGCGPAREYHAQALVLAQQLGDRGGEVDALSGLGEVERLVGGYDLAHQYHARALALAQQLGDRCGEVDALWGLAQVERLVGRFSEARDRYAHALRLARDLGYRRAEADALWGLGQVERLAGECGQAREYHIEALALARELGYRRAEAESLRGLGQVERLAGECGRARDYYTQALDLDWHLGYRRAAADALRGLGQVERLVGEFGQAREYHAQALALAQDLGYRRVEVDALRGLGQVERLVGECGQARKYHTQALILARSIGYRRAESDALRGLGQVERLIGEYGQARKYHIQALALAQDLGYRFGEADALRELGHVERLCGEYGQSREYHIRALNLARLLGSRRIEAEALRGLGQVERLVGQCGQARQLHTQALVLARELGYRRIEAQALWGLGEVERVVGECGQARRYYTEAFALARELGYRFGEVLALRGLGEVERLVGEYGQAREYYTHALVLARQLDYRRAEAEALCGLGHVASDTAERSQARECWGKALEIYEKLGVGTDAVRAAIRQLDG